MSDLTTDAVRVMQLQAECARLREALAQAEDVIASLTNPDPGPGADDPWADATDGWDGT